MIGYDCYLGREQSDAVWGPLRDLLVSEHFLDPRRYGFHATLRAPFELAHSVSVDDIVRHARAFARDQRPVPLADLTPRLLDGFIALTCPAPPASLASLAENCVRAFEPFRAPLSEADRSRRLRANLSARQLAHVETWGYPYVLEDFVFHMTLTGKLPADRTAAALQRITQEWAPLAGPVVIDAIAILEQPSREARFRVLERIPLGTDD
ncbi:MAG: DUF1045 domain-containing protein [Hyphomicrobiaceae bacterium]